MTDLGQVVPGWEPRAWPERRVFKGHAISMVPADMSQAQGLFEAFSRDTQGAIWTYLPYGPFLRLADFQAWMEETLFHTDPQFYAFVCPTTHQALGLAALMRLNPEHGVVEIGHINLSPALQKTIAATQGLYLLMHHCMDELGYRRFEWKCNALNAASRRAAERYGFTFEGIFRQSNVFKGRNRDTAWYAFLDSDWPQIKQGFETWLQPSNFDRAGRQRKTLSQCRQAL